MTAITAVLQLLGDTLDRAPTAETSDTPVWWLTGATAVLALATIALVIAATRGLDQLKQAREQLDEAKRDRHTQILTSLIERWNTPSMTEAFDLQSEFTDAGIASLFSRAGAPVAANKTLDARRLAESKRRGVLLRIPNFFEDALMLAEFAGSESGAFRSQLVYQFGGLAHYYWDSYWHLAVEEMRRVEADPEIYEYFERLVNEARSGASGALKA